MYGGRSERMARNGGKAIVNSLLAAALLVLSQAGPAAANEQRHGLSSFGELKYPPDFRRFDYVNPNAPKGGRLSIGVTDRTFDSFNGFILKGNPAEGLGIMAESGLQPGLLFDSLMTRALDEPDAVYGLIARSAEVAQDRKSATFHLRPEARFSDGSPVTAADVVASFNLLKNKGHPIYQTALHDVKAAVALDLHAVRYDFEGQFLRDLPLLVATLPVLSKAYYEKHSFEKSNLDKPLGSGPYEIAEYSQGSYVMYRRRKDYWAANLPVNAGRFNFDEIRYEYFRDRSIGLEALKAGEYDLREEFTSKSWAMEYNVPPVREGRLLLLTLPDGSPSGAQGVFFNLRRDKFKDIRVRRAFAYAFDFEWTNKNLFYGLYTRTQSFFENSDLKAEGRPSPAELALLEPFRGKFPPEALEEALRQPVTDGSGRDRNNLRVAARLLDEAGWKVSGGVRRNAAGEPLDVEFLSEDPVFERAFTPFLKNLQIIGVKAHWRRVDPAQYELRKKSFDFDVMTERFSMSPTPGPEARSYWSSKMAQVNGSYNLAGIASPVVDALLDKLLQAKSRNKLRTAAHALDRVLRAGHYWVPEWYKASHTIAVWDKFGRPDTKPKFDRGVADTWWFDPGKAARLEGGKTSAASSESKTAPREINK
jgi:microcin C transport system substrate-binding protein